MLGSRVEEISKSLSASSTSRGSKSARIEPQLAFDVTLCWFLRLWFLSQLDRDWLRTIISRAADTESSHTGFQLVRLIFERGIHEPSALQRQLAMSICPTLNYCGFALEPTEWWERTLSRDGTVFHLPPTAFAQLADIAQGASSTDICRLFPQVSDESLISEDVLVSADAPALIAKLYLRANILPRPWPDLSSLVNLDPTLEFTSRIFPPESITREYKSTFRWDSKSKQKNPAQAHACLKAICGFLNCQGGQLIIGVGDDCQVIGLAGDFSLFKVDSPFDELSQVIHELIKRNISPTPVGLVSIDFQPYGSFHIAIIHVKSSSQLHMLNFKGTEPALYVRDGNRTLHLRSHDLESFLKHYENS